MTSYIHAGAFARAKQWVFYSVDFRGIFLIDWGGILVYSDRLGGVSILFWMEFHLKMFEMNTGTEACTPA